MAVTQKFTNSELVSYVKLSPNHSGQRTKNIDTISIHCMAGNLTVESCGSIFASSSRQASSNYGIGSDGRIAMYVEEKNRSWCTSSSAVDQRAVTIEVANTSAASPWPVSEAAYQSLINLCVDICKRNNIKKLLWEGNKSLLGNVSRQNMVPHRWTAAKDCPGDYLYNRFGDIATKVNAKLLSNSDTVQPPVIQDSNEKIIWNFLKGKGLNNYAVAGIMGNIYAESGLEPKNLQNTYEKKFGMNDNEYTAAVDNGTYTNFIKDSAGYGLCQWTYWSRKEALLNYVKSVNKSIGDINAQCEYMWKEMQSYKNMMNVLSSATSVQQASDIFLLEFEKPADQSDTVKTKRAQYGMNYYNKNADENKFNIPYTVKVNTSALNIRKGAGTNYEITGCIRDNGIYTIIEESTGSGAKKWGKLKSGAGWISLDYCIKLN